MTPYFYQLTAGGATNFVGQPTTLTVKLFNFLYQPYNCGTFGCRINFLLEDTSNGDVSKNYHCVKCDGSTHSVDVTVWQESVVRLSVKCEDQVLNRSMLGGANQLLRFIHPSASQAKRVMMYEFIEPFDTSAYALLDGDAEPFVGCDVRLRINAPGEVELPPPSPVSVDEDSPPRKFRKLTSTSRVATTVTREVWGTSSQITSPMSVRHTSQTASSSSEMQQDSKSTNQTPLLSRVKQEPPDNDKPVQKPREAFSFAVPAVPVPGTSYGSKGKGSRDGPGDSIQQSTEKPNPGHQSNKTSTPKIHQSGSEGNGDSDTTSPSVSPITNIANGGRLSATTTIASEVTGIAPAGNSLSRTTSRLSINRSSALGKVRQKGEKIRGFFKQLFNRKRKLSSTSHESSIDQSSAVLLSPQAASVSSDLEPKSPASQSMWQVLKSRSRSTNGQESSFIDLSSPSANPVTPEVTDLANQEIASGKPISESTPDASVEKAQPAKADSTCATLHLRRRAELDLVVSDPGGADVHFTWSHDAKEMTFTPDLPGEYAVKVKGQEVRNVKQEKRLIVRGLEDFDATSVSYKKVSGFFGNVRHIITFPSDVFPGLYFEKEKYLNTSIADNIYRITGVLLRPEWITKDDGATYIEFPTPLAAEVYEQLPLIRDLILLYIQGLYFRSLAESADKKHLHYLSEESKAELLSEDENAAGLRSMRKSHVRVTSLANQKAAEKFFTFYNMGLQLNVLDLHSMRSWVDEEDPNSSSELSAKVRTRLDHPGLPKFDWLEIIVSPEVQAKDVVEKMLLQRNLDYEVVNNWYIVVQLKRYEGTEPSFGLYHCKECSHTWVSAYSFSGYPQSCPKCRHEPCKPLRQERVRSDAIGYRARPGAKTDPLQHDPELCGKCSDIGHPCAILRSALS